VTEKKIKDRLIGVVTSLVVAMISFLVYSYVSSFVTQAEYNKDKAVMQIMANDIGMIRKDVDLIKRHLINH